MRYLAAVLAVVALVTGTWALATERFTLAAGALVLELALWAVTHRRRSAGANPHSL